MTCCREVLGKSVVGKCACVWGSVDCRGVLKECCEGVLRRSVVEKRRSVVDKCWEGVLWRGVVKKCCGEVL